MGYYEEVLKDRPYSAIKLNAAETAYIDVSGHAATLAGTVTVAPPIIAGTSRSIGASAWRHSNALFKTTAENNPFTLEAWYLPLKVTGNVKIVSRLGAYDGLNANADFIRFTIPTSAGTFTAEWPIPDVSEAYHCVGLYTQSKIQLIINSEVASEVDLPDLFTFTSDAGTELHSGLAAVGTDKFCIDGVSTYAHTLDSARIYTHFVAGRDLIEMGQAVEVNGGVYWDGTNRTVGLQREYPTDAEWTDGILSEVGAAGNNLVPLVDQTTLLSKAGTWRTSFEIGATELTTLGGVMVDWDGDGSFIVEASLNGGGAWTTLTNGRVVPNLFNYNAVTNPVVDIRVTFTGGLASDPAVIRRLRLSAFENGFINPNSATRVSYLLGQSATLNASNSLEVNQPLERNIGAGVDFYGAYLAVQTDVTEDPKNIGTLEFWWNPRTAAISGSGGYVFDSRTAGGVSYMWLQASTGAFAWAGASAVYINGVLTSSGTYIAKLDEWHHIVYVPTTPFNLVFNVGQGQADARMGMMALYPAALTAGQALALYQSYSKVPVVRFDDPGVIAVAEVATPYNIYRYNWDISSGG